MEKARNSASSVKESSSIIRLIHSVQASVPAMGNTASGINESMKNSDNRHISAKQTSASALPALGDSKDMQKKSENTDKKSASKTFTWLKMLFIASSGTMTIGAQTYVLFKSLQYLNNKRKEDISKRKWEELEEAVKGTNPNFAPGEQNRKWRINCQRCVSVFEARMRGQNVTAQPNPYPDRPAFDDLSHPNAKTGIFSVYKSPDILDMSSKNEWDCEQKIREQMEKWGEGSRAIVAVIWKSGGGHVFNAVQINGHTEYVDPQNGNMYCLSYFSNIDTSKKVYLTRTDDQEFTNRIVLCTQEEAKGESL